jgi:glycosyltransferase involved in cell wall biosynthesis
LAPASAAPAGAYTALADQVAQFAHDAAALADAGGADFDVIHAHDWMTFPAALALRAATGTPFVAHVHSTAFDRNETPDPHVLAIETAGLTGAHRVIAVSHYTKALLVQRFALDPAAIAVVHNGWSHVRQAAPIGTAPRAPLVTFLGRVTYQKGPHAFLHAARRILEAVPHARFVLAGDGDLLASCRRLAAALGIGHRVAFPGFLGRAASADLLAASAAFVMPSLSEPFGIVALEAAAQGAPLVLSARAGVNEVVSAALRVDPADDAAIAAAVCRLLCDRPLAARLADRARIEATAMRWDDAARRIAALYETTVRRERVFPP